MKRKVKMQSHFSPPWGGKKGFGGRGISTIFWKDLHIWEYSQSDRIWLSRHIYNLWKDLQIWEYFQSDLIWLSRHLRTDLHIIAHKTFTTIFSIWSDLNIAASGTISGKVFHNGVFNLPFNKHTGIFNTPKKTTIPDERPIPEDWPSLSDQKQTLVVDRLITEPATQISAMRC